MNFFDRQLVFLGLLAFSLLGISPATALIPIDTVFVGDENNLNDTTGFGSVPYDYRIGTTEVTNGQYAAFLNNAAMSDTHGLYNTEMGDNPRGGITRSGSEGAYQYQTKATFASKPVNFVSFWDAARFSNWLTTGDTETGVYNLNGVTNPTNNTITRNSTAWNNGGVAIASEDEWYKAAYYDPMLDSGSGGYWLYPTQSDSVPTATNPNGTDANSANYNRAVPTETEVGGYSLADSHYGTFDQGGNVWEWNEAILSATNRGLRAGSFDDGGPYGRFLRSSDRDPGEMPTTEDYYLGFRVSSLAPIPEPSDYAAIAGIFGLSLAFTRRAENRSSRGCL